MTLHVPKNKDAGSFSKAWQNNFWQIVLGIQRTVDQLLANFVGTENDVNSKRAFLDKAREWFDVLAGSAARLTVTRKLGQRVIDLVPEHQDIIEAGQVFANRSPAPIRLKAGSNITLTKKLGETTIAVVPEDQDIIEAGQVFANRSPAPINLKAGSNITLTKKLGETTIAASGGGVSFSDVLKIVSLRG